MVDTRPSPTLFGAVHLSNQSGEFDQILEAKRRASRGEGDVVVDGREAGPRQGNRGQGVLVVVEDEVLGAPVVASRGDGELTPE
jgi:hypothetical protein